MAQKADSDVFKCLTLGPQLKDIQLTVIEEKILSLVHTTLGCNK